MGLSIESPFLLRQRALFPYNAQIALAIIFFCFGLPAAALPITNVSSSQELCASVSWEQIVIFILVNYVTHAITVKSYPGEKKRETILWNIAALLWPYSGAFKGIMAIYTRARFTNDPLERALRAGALCVVARNYGPTDKIDSVRPHKHPHEPWTPPPMFPIPGCIKKTDANPASDGTANVQIQGCQYDWRVNPKITRVHGQYNLPDGYHLHRLVDDVVIEKLYKGDIEISSSLSTPKVIASIVQICASVLTLYRARGTQLQQYGWAAFGLTVIPYAIMSIVNLLANLVSPEYSAVYMVKSEVMTEAEHVKGEFDGCIGKMRDTQSEPTQQSANSTQQSTEPGQQSQEPAQQSQAPKQQSHESVQQLQESEKQPQKPTRRPDDVGHHICLFHHDPRTSISPRHASVPAENHYIYKSDSNTTISVPARGQRLDVPPDHNYYVWIGVVLFLSLVVIAAPYLIIYGLTHYHHGPESTPVQRDFIEAWLVIGQVTGLIVAFYLWLSENISLRHRYIGFIVLVTIAGTPSIGGFIMAGLEITHSQLCIILW
jgi:hypothetical protein